MQKNQASEQRFRSVFINVTVVLLFVVLMLYFIRYFEQSRPSVHRVALEQLAQTFSENINKAHWQWQAEGRPQIIIISTFAPRIDDPKTLVEIDKRPVFMDENGWPKAEASRSGCQTIWRMVLNLPMELDGAGIMASYYAEDDGPNTYCRYGLANGPYFEYNNFSGEVSGVR